MKEIDYEKKINIIPKLDKVDFKDIFRLKDINKSVIEI